MAKEIMKTNDLTFCDRPNLVLATVLSYNNTDIAFSTYGEYWRQLRKICVIELLSAKRVQSFRHIREEEVLDVVKSISASEGSVVNLTKKIAALTYGITARTAFGKKNIHQEAFNLAMDEAITLLGGVCIVDLYPSIKMFRWMSSVKAKLEKATRDLDIILQNIIDDHKSSHREESKDEDLVDKAVIQDLFTAGGETSSGVVLWGMSEMLPNGMKNEELDMTESFGLTVGRKYDLCLIPITRRT
ncbi:cytochrome P450 71D10 [Trifolium repens]|nr:cytochrome P450 71D10 [Trifolium repens]